MSSIKRLVEVGWLRCGPAKAVGVLGGGQIYIRVRRCGTGVLSAIGNIYSLAGIIQG